MPTTCHKSLFFASDPDSPSISNPQNNCSRTTALAGDAHCHLRINIPASPERPALLRSSPRSATRPAWPPSSLEKPLPLPLLWPPGFPSLCPDLNSSGVSFLLGANPNCIPGLQPRASACALSPLHILPGTQTFSMSSLWLLPLWLLQTIWSTVWTLASVRLSISEGDTLAPDCAKARPRRRMWTSREVWR